MYATLSLFGGILFYKGIDFVVHALEGKVGDHNVDIDLYDLDGSSSGNSPRNRNTSSNMKSGGGSKVDGAKGESSATEGAVAPSSAFPRADRESASHSAHNFPHEHDVVVELSTGSSTVRPSPDLHTLQLRMAGKVQQQQKPASPVSALTPEMKSGAGEDMLTAAEEGVGEGADVPKPEAVEEGDNEKLVRMGVMTAIAIGIHNFPEGLATFVAALSDPSVGLALAVAIAIHNIPEGLCVAIPVYYATGNRWKAFGWALLSGVSEPIGAALGWLILKDIMSELVYGILFGVVSGMMVNITLHELIPTAVRYDPADKVTTNSIIVGMAVMAASLTLFLY